MRPDRVVVVAPQGQLAPCIIQAVEYFLVQEPVAQAAVERLDEGVLLRFPWVGVVPRHIVLIGQFQDRPTGELGPSVTDNATRLAIDSDEGTEFPGNPCAGEAGVSRSI